VPKHGPESNHNDEQQLARLQSQLDLATPPSWLGRDKKDAANPKTFQDSPSLIWETTTCYIMLIMHFNTVIIGNLWTLWEIL
jgi:hypothetical protein